MTTSSPQVRWFIAAFAAVVLFFVGSTAYSQLQEHESSDLSASLASNAMPSIERITVARTELRQIDSLTDDYVFGTPDGRAAVLASMLDSRKELHAAVDEYLHLPVYPGETALWDEIRRSIADVDSGIAEVRAFVEAGDLERARAAEQQLDAVCAHALQVLYEDIQFNARHAVALSEEIIARHAYSQRVAVSLDVVSTLLTVLLAFFVVRVANAHSRIERERNDLLRRRADELEQFAGRVAHDIRNPLAGVRFTLQHLRRLGEGSEKIAAAVDRGARGVDRAAAILDALLSFAQAAARPSPSARASLRETVAGVLEDVEPLAREAGVEIRAGALPACEVACEPSILAVVASNLLRNAIRHMGDGDERVVTVRAEELAASVRLVVEDTGVGVPLDMREAIFEPFVRGRGQGGDGIGLGLATVRRICTAHGGRVWHEPREGGGSRFTVDAPKAEASERPRHSLSAAHAG